MAGNAGRERILSTCGPSRGLSLGGVLRCNTLKSIL
jgi:hypothetical protein